MPLVDSKCSNCGPCADHKFTLLCGRCGSVKYCSKVCQRAHWKGGHKEQCDKLVLQSAAAAHAKVVDELAARHADDLAAQRTLLVSEASAASAKAASRLNLVQEQSSKMMKELQAIKHREEENKCVGSFLPPPPRVRPDVVFSKDILLAPSDCVSLFVTLE